MGKRIEEMDAQELMNFWKSNDIPKADQIEMMKAMAAPGYGKTVKEAIADSNGSGSRSATKNGTMAQPSAPGENVGIIDNPEDIQRRFRDDYVEATEYNKGSEVEDTKKSPKKKAVPKNGPDDDDEDDDEDVQGGDMGDDGEFEPDGQDDDDDEDDQKPPMRQSTKKATKKSLAANTVEDYEDSYYGNLLKGANGREIAEVVDSAPVVERMTDVHAHGFAVLESKLDRAIAEVQKSNARAARAEAMLKSQAAEVEKLKVQVANNHNKMLEATAEYIEKSFASTGEALTKAQVSAPVQQSPSPQAGNVVPLVTRPTVNGAIATITPGGAERIEKSNRLSGDYKRDKRALTKSLEAAAEAGEDGATDILAMIDNVKPGQDFNNIAALMPDEWWGK